MKRTRKSGQILILVLLVVVVALAVGLSVASRNLTNLRTSTQADQSQRAFTAAEGGVEDVLSRLNTVASVVNSSNPGQIGGGCTKNGSNVEANCTLTTASTGVAGTVNVIGQPTYEKSVELGDVAQVNLRINSTTLYNGSFTISWLKTSDTVPDTLEFTFVCTNDSSTTCGLNVNGVSVSNTKITTAYGQYRTAFTSDIYISGQSSSIGACQTTSPPWTCKEVFTVSGNMELLRIKAFYNRTTISVGTVGATFPVQTYQITSTATTDSGVSRKVQVSRDALPQLPAVFDYVLYSGQDIIK